MLVCAKCGLENLDGSKRCDRCLATLARPVEPGAGAPSEAGSTVRGLLIGSAAAAAAAALWVVIAHAADRELAFLVVLVGAAAGIGVIIGTRRADPLHGLLAAVITVAAFFGAKVALTSWQFADWNAERRTELASDDYQIARIADELMAERWSKARAEGAEVDEDDERDVPAAAEGIASDYGKRDWTEAQARWRRKPASERERLVAEQLAEDEREMAESDEAIGLVAALRSFWGIGFTLAAIGLAWGMGANAEMKILGATFTARTRDAA